MKRLKLLFIVLIFSTIFTSSIFGMDKQLNIAMVLWRGFTEAEKGFQDELKDLGYTIQYTIIDAEQDRSVLAEKLRYELSPQLHEYDYVYSFGTTASTLTSMFIKNKVPHIFNIVTDPVKTGIANSMESAGVNVCGISHNISLQDQIENALMIKNIKTLGFIFNAREQNSNIIRDQLFIIAKTLNFNIIDYRIAPSENENLLRSKLKEMIRQTDNLDAVYLPTDSYLVSNSDLIAQELKEAKIMSIGAQKEYVASGVFMGLVPDYYQLGRNAAKLIDRNIKGEELKNIPVQTETNPKIMINSTTRDILRISIPVNIAQTAIFLE